MCVMNGCSESTLGNYCYEHAKPSTRRDAAIVFNAFDDAFDEGPGGCSLELLLTIVSTLGTNEVAFAAFMRLVQTAKELAERRAKAVNDEGKHERADKLAAALGDK